MIGIFIKEEWKIITKKKREKRFGLMIGGKKEGAFFRQEVLRKMYGKEAVKKKEGWKGLIAKLKCQ
jgi:hypothetical protein